MTAHFTMPPEWHPQDWLWIGFPHLAEEWSGVIDKAQEQIAAFASAVADSGQEVRLVVRDAANEMRAKSLVSAAVKLERRTYGDVWLRDTGPLVVLDQAANRSAGLFDNSGNDTSGDYDVADSGDNDDFGGDFGGGDSSDA